MRPSARTALLLALLLAAPVALAGCLKDVRQQNTHLLFFLDVREDGRIGDFAVLETVITHVTLTPNETGLERASVLIRQTVDLVSIHEGGARKLVEADIPYKVYDRVAIGVNVTNALLHDGTPTKVAVPPDNIYFVEKKFRTLLAGDFAYTFVLNVARGPGPDGVEEYFIQSHPESSGAGRV